MIQTAADLNKVLPNGFLWDQTFLFLKMLLSAQSTVDFYEPNTAERQNGRHFNEQQNLDYNYRKT